jgi:hypothetical protein
MQAWLACLQTLWWMIKVRGVDKDWNNESSALMFVLFELQILNELHTKVRK